jgi:hypothetical protein
MSYEKSPDPIFFPIKPKERFSIFEAGKTVVMGTTTIPEDILFSVDSKVLDDMDDTLFSQWVVKHKKVNTPDFFGKHLLHHYVRTLNVTRVTILLNTQMVDFTIKEDGMTAFELAKSLPPSKKCYEIFKMLCFWEVPNK